MITLYALSRSVEVRKASPGQPVALAFIAFCCCFLVGVWLAS